MNKDSLLQMRRILSNYLSTQQSIDKVDCVELYINLNRFLDPEKYEENIKILRLHDEKHGKN